MAFAVVLILLVVGSVLFHFLSPWNFTPLASNWDDVDFTVDVTLWVTGFVFVAVNLFMAYCVFRYRHRGDRRSTYEPENKKLETWLTVVTAVGVALMLAPGLFVWARFVQVPEDAHTVEAVGQQWHWTYRLPGEDGKFGEVRAELISQDNPFGMVAEDPNGRDDVLVDDPELHLPIDRPVKMLLRSKDVLHNYTVAQFRVKMDLVPGMVTYMWFTPTETGRFEVLCEELCGIAHFAMRGAVVVEPDDDYAAWLASHPTFAETQSAPPGDPEVGKGLYAVCASCHGQQGEGMAVMNAPRLAGQSPWYLKQELIAFRTGLRGTHEEDTYGRQMVPMAKTLADERAIDNVVAYIDSLPAEPAPVTIEGNAERGEALYRVCGNCHGGGGEGRYATKAPLVAGVDDWYLARQLGNFKSGIRGTHPADYYGMQMGFMGRSLKDERAINDLVAYINTLAAEARAATVASR